MSSSKSELKRAPSPGPAGRGSQAKRGEWTQSLYMNRSKEATGSLEHGIKIDPQEIKMAFDFFDVQKKGVLKAKDLKARLSVFYPNMSSKEYQFLLGDPSQDFTLETLMSLLQDNDLSGFDPVQEAFKVYDTDGSGM
eukprot:TRINITY_DN1976_c0_g1_i1.p1 TRINITY_DN1976_c0_g1~~TRINITY_DN1976_c0_g1_i1.p1  ORF type:complete len:161 (+),score=26.88 TRINITY_DN1976_c0_g1_i1:75-485(+)